MRIIHSTVLAGLGLLPVYAVGTDGGVDLAPRFELGAEVFYVSRSVVRHEMAADLLETAEKITVRSETGMSLVVTQVSSNGEAEVIWTPHYVVLSSDGVMPGMNAALDYDSREPAAGGSPLSPGFSRFVARPVRVRVSPRGDILSFDQPDTGPADDVVSRLVQMFFSREALAQLPLFITTGAPSPARVRDEWQRRQRIEFPLGDVALELHQTLRFERKAPRLQTARLAMHGTIIATAAGAGAVGGGGMLPGATLTVESGSAAGVFEWDFAHGQLRAAESSVELATVIDTRVGRMRLEQHMTASVDRLSARAFERMRRAPAGRTGRGEP